MVSSKHKLKEKSLWPAFGLFQFRLCTGPDSLPELDARIGQPYLSRQRTQVAASFADAIARGCVIFSGISG
jgi:hypothetical protein